MTTLIVARAVSVTEFEKLAVQISRVVFVVGSAIPITIHFCSNIVFSQNFERHICVRNSNRDRLNISYIGNS